MHDSMKDFPLTLRKNVAICELAAAMFKARAEVYGGNPDMKTAPPHVRERFIHLADAQIAALKPAERIVTTGLRNEQGVIGQIEPSAHRRLGSEGAAS